MDNIKTQVEIKSVEADNQQKCKIDADIPAFGSSYDIRFITWWNDQGEAPKAGERGTAEMKATARQPYFIKKGLLEEGEPDGSEKLYQLYWEMLSFAPTGASNGGSEGNVPVASQTALSKPSGSGGGVVYLDANLRYRTDMEGVNDRKAVSDILSMVEAGTYTLDGLIEDAEQLAAWYNSRNAARLSAGMVGAAQATGAVVKKVEPEIKNRADLTKFTKDRGWTKSQILQALNDAGFKDSQAYLAVDGHTVMGLTELLVLAIDG